MAKYFEKNSRGCFALTKISRDTEIFRETKRCADVDFLPPGVLTSNIFWIMNVMTSYNRLEKKDREDYIKLYNLHSFMNRLDEKKLSEELKLLLERLRERKKLRRMKIRFIEQDDVKAEQILQILNICETNGFDSKLKSELSCFNHSDRPNAKVMCAGSDRTHDPWKIITDKPIKNGEEITISRDQHQLLKNRQQRLEILRTLLKDEEETKNDDFFMKKYDEMEELMIERVDTFYSEERYPEPYLRYSPEKSRLEVDVYKQLYTISYERKAWVEFTFEFAREGFSAGFLGYQNSENQELKESFEYDCENFAKLAETLQNMLGKVLVKPQLWKRRQNVKNYVLEKRMSSASKSR